MSVRTQIYLKEDQLRELKVKAHTIGTTVSELIRKSIDMFLFKAPGEKSLQNDPLLQMIGRIKGRKDDVKAMDTVLYGRR